MLWGIAAIKALLLAKFMLIGKALRLGENKNMPLAWPTLYQSALTLVLLIILTTLEEILVGALHHRTIKESLTHVAGDRLDIVLATFLIMFLILVPYFAFRNLAEVLGPGVLPRLFFTDPVPPLFLLRPNKLRIARLLTGEPRRNGAVAGGSSPL